MGRSLRGRLARTLGLTAALSVAATALITFGLVRRLSEQRALEELGRQADAIALEANDIQPRQLTSLRQLLRASGSLVALVGPAGRVTAAEDSVANVVERIDLSPVLAGRRIEGVVSAERDVYAYVAIPVAGPRGRTAGVVLARPTGVTRAMSRSVLARVGLAAGLAVILAVLASALLSRRLTDPIRRVADATARAAEGDLAHRVPVEGEDEVADLARRFNAMADALLEARRREHEFLASVSHELRTPITAIRGYAEAMAEGVVADGPGRTEALSVISEETARLERLVQDVMDLARLGAGELRLEPAEVDLGDVLREAAKAHAGGAAGAGVSLEAEVGERLVLITDALRVRQIVGNLVENALRVTPAGGRVRVSGRAAPGAVVVEVADTGPGIATRDLPHVFERSYLWGISKGMREVGTGLGLAIVRQLSAALGGSIEVDSVVGKGTTFRLTLPAHIVRRPAHTAPA
ncbi:MAG: ATP-binding protein [Actinomycetota bacterium]